MPNTIISPNMNLPVPVPTVDPGPDYANNEVQCFNTIDAHNHTPGNGVQITPAGLNINSTLDLQNQTLNNVGQINLTSQSVVSTISTIFEQGVDLYFNDGNGNSIRITQNGAVSGSTGTITGLPSGTASASYQSISGTFQFQSATNTPANITGATVSIAPQVASANSISLAAPNPLSSSYQFTFPNGTPTNSSFLKTDSSGTLSYTDVNFVLPPGMIMMFGGISIPTGWLLCDGSIVSQTTYANLYAVIGPAFNLGGEGVGNFRVPDFRRRVGAGSGGVSSIYLGNNIGDRGGFETHTLAIAELPSHNHPGNYPTLIAAAGGGFAGSGLTTNSGPGTTPTNVAAQGSGQPVPIIQPSLVVNFIIKY